MPIYKIQGKKDGLQKYKVQINYTNASGEHKQLKRLVYGNQEAISCEKKLYEYAKEFEESRLLTVNDLYNEYMKVKKQEVRETSYEKTKRILQRHILNELGKIKLKKISISNISEWKNHIGEKDLQIRTKQNIVKELSALFNFGVRYQYMQSNPLSIIGNFKNVYFEKPQDRINYYTAEEFMRFKAAALNCAEKEQDYRFYTFFCIAFYTGARKGEINALKWSDIEGNVMHIRRSVSQKVKGKSIVETPPKTPSSYRDIIMPKPLIEVLSIQKQRQHRLVNYSDDFRICGAASCLSDTAISNANDKYAKLAGLHHIKIHDFRHSHASVLINEGINIKEISRRLGHSKVEITWDTYSHIYPVEEEKAIAILDKCK